VAHNGLLYAKPIWNMERLLNGLILYAKPTMLIHAKTLSNFLLCGRKNRRERQKNRKERRRWPRIEASISIEIKR
jgi:hypothetical protein